MGNAPVARDSRSSIWRIASVPVVVYHLRHPMNCPRCRRELDPIVVEGVEVDVCRHGCGGIWFDQWELQRFDDPGEVADRLVAGVQVDLSLDLDLTARMACPRCDDVVLMRRPFSKDLRVFIDECPSCGGIWLDYGELYEIREGLRGSESAEPRTTAQASDVLRRMLFHRQGGEA